VTADFEIKGDHEFIVSTFMLGAGPISAVCTWDGRLARVLAAETAIGRWHEGR